jgi:hypothetical protein
VAVQGYSSASAKNAGKVLADFKMEILPAGENP